MSSKTSSNRSTSRRSFGSFVFTASRGLSSSLPFGRSRCSERHRKLVFGRRLVSGAADWRKTIPAFFCIVHGNEAVRAPREQLALMPERGDSPAWDSSDRDSKQR
jgi:hypothetical protein